MFQFNEYLLRDLGLEKMLDEHKRSLLEHIQHELQVRVGAILSKGMSTCQLVEFGELSSSNTSEALLWLESNRPGYRQIVIVELKKIQQEVIAHKDEILTVAGEPMQ